MNLKQARLSPDGKKIATPIFDANRGVNDMWILDAETGAARRVIIGPGTVDSPVWAPDSGRLAFSRAYDTPPKLFVRGIGASDAEETIPEGYFQTPTDWSYDGRFIAFGNTSFSQIGNELKGDVWLVDMARNRKVVPLISTVTHRTGVGPLDPHYQGGCKMTDSVPLLDLLDLPLLNLAETFVGRHVLEDFAYQ